jgi:hypothetical protein
MDVAKVAVIAPMETALAVIAQAVRVANAASDAPAPATIIFAMASPAMIGLAVTMNAVRRANLDRATRRMVKIAVIASPSAWRVPVLLRAAKPKP